ncbi:MAG: ferrous iron transport protein A [Eubacterium sp.]|nr:ferrous iron transport protein A [Eubacterium sp.]
MNLNVADLGKEYIISAINTGGDDEMESFLFSLGCYSGESITVVDRKKNNLVVSIKDARYNIDKELAEAIEIEG